MFVCLGLGAGSQPFAKMVFTFADRVVDVILAIVQVRGKPKTIPAWRFDDIGHSRAFHDLPGFHIRGVDADYGRPLGLVNQGEHCRSQFLEPLYQPVCLLSQNKVAKIKIFDKRGSFSQTPAM